MLFFISLRYAFLCDKWLATDREDGCTYRSLYPANTELKDGKTLFTSITRFNLFDDYLWLSVLSRPSFSRFTRVQRLYCISSMVSLSMLGSAMWFNSLNTDQTYGIKIGPIKINYLQVFVGIMTAVISCPPSVLMVMLFKNRTFKGEILQKGTERYNMNIKSGAFLPWPFVYVAYGFAIVGIGSGTFFTTLYSLQWGSNTSEDWLLSILFGTANDVIFLAPIKVC